MDFNALIKSSGLAKYNMENASKMRNATLLRRFCGGSSELRVAI
jgi:hypothetical protein